jgi:methionyl-tRNA formyltransferase
VRVVFAGTPRAALPSLDAIAGSRHELIAVITRPDAPAGRGRRLEASPVRVRAQELGLPVLTPHSVKEPEFLDELRRLGPDACPVVAYGNLIPQVVLDLPRHGWINLHFSLLPAWRGAAPVQHAIMAGDEVTGASTFRLERGLDTGPVYGVMTEAIRPTDTAGDLLDRLAQGGAGLLVATLDGIERGDLVATPQRADGVSHAPKLEVADGRVVWARPARAIDRLVRACTPAPGAWTTFRGERLKLAPLTLAAPDEVPGHGTLEPATLLVTKRAVFVGTGTLPVRLGIVQAHGKRPMPAADWARGSRIEAGERLSDE